MAEGAAAGQAADHVGLVEVVADQAQPPLGVEVAVLVGDDARGFLAAVLQRVQAERRQRGGVVVAEDAEHAAFLAQAVIVGAAAAGFRHRSTLVVSKDHGRPLLRPARPRTPR